MTYRFLIALLSCAGLVACTADAEIGPKASSGGEGFGGGSSDNAAGDGGADGLGSDCIGARGDLDNYFCGQPCTGAAGERVGVNCGRACIGQADEIRGGNCTPPQPYGGIYGRCLEVGEELEAKVIGAVCCEGLARISLEMPTNQGCESEAPPSLLVCAACGDGTCDGPENSCNCADDCG